MIITPKKSKQLIRIASYLLLFAILSNILYIPCYFYISHINRNNVIEHYEHKLSSGMQMLDSSVESFTAFGYLVSESIDYKELNYINAQPDSGYLTNLRKTMSTYLTLPYNFISNFGLIQNDDVLFTSSQVYYDRELLTHDSYFTCDREDYFDGFTGAYCTLPSAHFSQSPGKSYDAITIGYRCSRANNFYFFVHYPVDQLTALFVDDEMLSSNQISLYSGGTLLYSSGTPANGSHELLVATSDTFFGLRLELQLSDSYIQKDLAGFQFLVKIFLAIILMAICLWVVIFSLRISRPFDQISKVLYETGNFIENEDSKNSINTLVNSIRNMGIKLSDYTQVIEEQKEHNRIHILEKALYKGLYTEESNQAFAEAFPDFPAQWQLVFIQYISDGVFMNADSIQYLLTQYFQQRIPSAILLPYSKDILLAIFPVEGESAPQTTEELESAQKDLQEQYPISISYTCSQVYDHYRLLSDAFWQLEYESLTLQQSASVESDKKDLPISIQQLQNIYLALQNGDEQSALITLKNSSAGFLDHDDNDFTTAKYSFQMIIYILVRLKLENDSLLDVTLPNFKRNNIRLLFEDELPKCFTEITARINYQHTEQTKNLDFNIFTYINENIDNPQLSVSMVTDYFHISAPTLQKRICSRIGKTFSAYVTDIRMQKAQKMLHDTSRSVQEIALAIGYTNANSFYKAYKRHFGEAPTSAKQNNGE